MTDSGRFSLPRFGARTRRTATIGLLSAVALFGLFLRFYPDTPMWLDEALSVHIASLPISEIPDALRRDGHPPLYYFLLSVWIDVFGDSDLAARSLSAVLGIGGVAATTAVARRIAGPRAGVTTLVVMFASPFAIRYSTEARMYSLLMLLVPVGWFAVEALRTNWSRRAAVGVAAVTAALLLTHYWTIFLLGSVGLLLLLQAVRAADADARVGARHVVGAMCGGIVLTAPWVPGFLFQLRNTGTPWASPSRPTKVISESILSFSGPFGPEATISITVLTAAVLLGVFAHRCDDTTLILRPPADPAIRALLLVIGLTVVVGGTGTYLAGSAFQGRYGAVWYPLVAVLAGIGISKLTAWTRLVVLALLSALGFAAVVAGFGEDRTQVATHVETIVAGAGPDDLVVFCPDQLGPAGSRALDGRLRSVSYPDLDADPAFVDWVDYEVRNRASDPVAFAEALLADLPADATVWVVWNGEYRTFEGKCNQLVDTIAVNRQSGEVVTNADGGTYFESANLYRYVGAS